VCPADPGTIVAELRRRLDDAEANAVRVVDEFRAELAVVGANYLWRRRVSPNCTTPAPNARVCRRELPPRDRAAAEDRHRRDIR